MVHHILELDLNKRLDLNNLESMCISRLLLNITMGNNSKLKSPSIIMKGLFLLFNTIDVSIYFRDPFFCCGCFVFAVNIYFCGCLVFSLSILLKPSILLDCF